MKCSECEYCEKAMLGLPMYCTYGGRKVFLNNWTFEEDEKPDCCIYRDEKETLVKLLISMNVNVLRCAVAYAENYLKYGVDVTKKAETAMEMITILERARREGYRERIEYERQSREQNLYRRSERGDSKLGKGEPEVSKPGV